MIAHIRGILIEKNLQKAVVEAGGIGYEIEIASFAAEKLPAIDSEVKLYITESVSMYAGGTTLYGFMSKDEKELFLLLKQEVPGAGARKALEYLEKISKSVPDFKKAVLNRNINLLESVFGFTKKTAEKLVASLKDKISQVAVSGSEKYDKREDSKRDDAVSGLVALGYSINIAKQAVDKVLETESGSCKIEDIIRRSLRYL